MNEDELEELHRELELLREAQSIGRYGAFEWDARTDTFIRSDRAFELLGVSPPPPEPCWADFESSLHPDDADDVEQAKQEVLETGIHPEVRYRVVWPDGEVRHIISRGRILHEDGEAIGIVGYIQDVTERVQAEREMTRQRRMIEDAQRLGQMGAWSYDVSTGEVTWSEATHHIHGLEPGTRMTLETILAMLGPDDRARIEAHVERAIQEHRPYEDRVEIHQPDGGRVIAQVTGKVEVIGGKTHRIYGIIQDITDQESRFEERLRLDRMQTLTQVAGGLAHDLNNYLTATALALSALDQASLPPDEQESLQDAFAGLRAGRWASNRLLAFASDGTGEQALIDLCQLLPEVARFTLRGRQTALDVDLPPEPVHVRGDRGQLEQVVSNLVLNASQAMKGRGRVRLVIRRAEDVARFEIHDEGPGVAETLRERIFDPHVSTKVHGTGLGLATCRTVVERHEGSIDLVPSDEGACFRVELPARAGSRPRPRTQVPGVESSRLQDTRVLIYDDEAMIRRLLSRLLPEYGVTVVTCHTAEQLRNVEEQGERIDVAILDATVPGEPGGIELAPRLRARWPEARLVLSSGYAQESAAQVQDAAFDALLPKPYALPELLSVLVRALESPGIGAR